MRFSAVNHLKKEAFTLIELAIVLVIIGLLVGFGTGIIGVLTKRTKYMESREDLKRASEALKGYAIRFGYLPPSRPFDQYDPEKPDPAFNLVGVKGHDSQNRALLYQVAPELTSGDLCTLNATTLTITDKGNPKSNLAYLVIGAGLNYNLQTNRTIYTQGQANVDDFPYDFNRPEEYDDIVEYVSLYELQQQRCNYASGTYCNNLVVYLDNAINSFKLDDGSCSSGSSVILGSSQQLETYIASGCKNSCGLFTFSELIAYDSNKNCQVEIERQGQNCVPRDR